MPHAHEETADPKTADERFFYKVEKWTKDGLSVEYPMLYAGDDISKAREIFHAVVAHRPCIRLTIRQRARVLEEWPRG